MRDAWRNLQLNVLRKKIRKNRTFLFPGNKIIFRDRLKSGCMHTDCPCEVGCRFGTLVSEPAGSVPSHGVPDITYRAGLGDPAYSTIRVIRQHASLPRRSAAKAGRIKENKTRSLIKRRFLSKTYVPESNKTKDNDNKINQDKTSFKNGVRRGV
jgi:hypothetical protein